MSHSATELNPGLKPPLTPQLKDSHFAYDPSRSTEWRSLVLEHRQLLNDDPGVRALNERAQVVPNGSALVFEKKEDGTIANPLDFDFAEHGLPTPPAETTPLAVLFGDSPETESIRTVSLILRTKDGSLSKRNLEQPDMPVGTRRLVPQWVDPGSSYKTGEHLHLTKKADNEQTLTIALINDGERGEEQPQDIRVVRAAPTETESMLMSTERTEKRAGRLKRAGRWLAGVALVSGILAGTYHEAAPEPKPQSYIEYVGDGAAINRLEHNLDLFAEGNTEKLDMIAAKRGFDSHPVAFESLKAVDTADSIDEVETAAAQALKPLGIRFSFLENKIEDHQTETEYHGISSKDTEAAKQTALGILDGVNELGPIVTKGTMFDVRVVGKIVDDSVSFLPAGNYDANDGHRPLINIRIDDSSGAIQEVFVHEEAHHENITDATIDYAANQLNREGFEYGDDGSGNGVIGKDIVREYAGTNTDEDTASMVEYLFSSSAAIDTDGDSVMQQKLRYVLASLESEYPGASAAVLRYANEYNQPIESRVAGQFNRLRGDSRAVFVVTTLLSLGAAAAFVKTRQQQEAQTAAGTKR